MIDIAISVEAGDWPPPEELDRLSRRAVDAAARALWPKPPATELSIVFSDDESVRRLNAEWRGKDKATNVLSFPAFPDQKAVVPPMLGDIVLAAETVRREAQEEDKPFEHHLTHLIVHGFMHLAGYDHETDEQADEMEALERRILAALAIPDPYA